jgi:uncharacterized membrane protein YheB (UPF0754 family)
MARKKGTKNLLKELGKDKKDNKKNKKVVSEVENDDILKPKKQRKRKLKQSFVDTGTSYIAKKIIFRIVKDDGKTEDIVKEYPVPVEFNKNKVNKLTKAHNGKDWMIITDVVTDEKDLVFVLQPSDI